VSRVAIKPELIRWARKRAGLTVAALREQFPKFEAWERGEVQPTFRQLEDLAKKTATPFGYLFLPKPPEERLPVPDFRTVRKGRIKQPSVNLMETLQTMQRRQDWMRDFLVEQGALPLPFIASADMQQRPEAVAASILETLNLTQDWAQYEPSWSAALSALRRTVEASGILVFINGIVGNDTHRTLNPKEFRGFVLCDDYAPLIFVNGADAKGAQMFTLAHEMVHLWLGRAGIFSLDELQPANDEAEEFCNKVAAEFLVPAAQLRNCWREAEADKEPFQFLARRFKVSPIVTARRALDLSLIDREMFFEFYHAHEKDERRKKQKQGGGDFYTTQHARLDRRFVSAVVRAVYEGRLPYSDAYKLTGLHGQTFDRYTKTLGFNTAG
jgi:Zn-dependent peptidase ImmA (M78 family)